MLLVGVIIFVVGLAVILSKSAANPYRMYMEQGYINTISNDPLAMVMGIPLCFFGIFVLFKVFNPKVKKRHKQ